MLHSRHGCHCHARPLARPARISRRGPQKPDISTHGSRGGAARHVGVGELIAHSLCNRAIPKRVAATPGSR